MEHNTATFELQPHTDIPYIRIYLLGKSFNLFMFYMIVDMCVAVAIFVDDDDVELLHILE